MINKLTLVMLVLTLSMTAQDKDNRLTAYTEVTAYDLSQYNYTLDVNYRITDRVSLSSWNTVTSGRTEQQGFNYSVVSTLLNLKSKNLENTLSFGYSRTEQYSFDFTNRQIVLKLRIKLL
jgi:hypothetical protein